MNSLKKRTLLIALTVTALTVFALAGIASAQGGPPPGRGYGGTAAVPLSSDEVEALNAVLQDEYHAWAVYDSVIADFGEVSPFVQIQRAEAQHAAALERMFDRYGLDVPENDWADAEIPGFETVEAACAGGVEAETANADLYDWALSVTDKSDLTQVFTHLQSASLDMHLPAFEACDVTPALDGSGMRNGWSQGRGRGQGDGWSNRPLGPVNPEDCINPDGPQYDRNRAGGRGWNR